MQAKDFSCDIVERRKKKKQKVSGEDVESEMDPKSMDYEQLRETAVRDLISLEKQFQDLRNALYHERTQQVSLFP